MPPPGCFTPPSPPPPSSLPPSLLRPATAIITKTSGIHHRYKSRLLATHACSSHRLTTRARMAHLFQESTLHPDTHTRTHTHTRVWHIAFIHVEAYKLWVKIIMTAICVPDYVFFFFSLASAFICEPQGAVKKKKEREKKVNMGSSPLELHTRGQLLTNHLHTTSFSSCVATFSERCWCWWAVIFYFACLDHQK